MPPETDPIENAPVLTDPQNWAARSHRELYDAVHHNNDPGQAGEIGTEWGRYGTELTESARTISALITASESKWTGAAADGARAAMKKLADWVTETASTAVDVGTKVAEQGRVMESARAQMPAPVEFDWNRAAAALAAPGTAAFVLASADIAVANAQSRAAHDQAVAVMTSMENNSRQIDSSTPVFKPPFNPVTGEVEEPVMATARMSGAPTLAGAEALMGTHAQGAGAGTAPAPTGSAPGGVPQGGGSYTPAAAAMPAGGAGGGGGSWVSPPAPIRPDTTAAAAASYAPPSYTPQFPNGGGTTYTGGSDYKPQFPAGGTPYPGMAPTGSTPRPHTTGPNTTGPKIPSSLTNPGNYLPKDTNLPKGMTPPATSGGGGGGGAAAAAAAMKGLGGGGGGFGGGAGLSGAAGGAGGGAMQSGGAAGVAAGQSARPGLPVGMTAPGGATAAGGAMGGAPMAGAAGGRGQEDKERKSASYIMGGDLFEVPGENLPPSVIGGAKPKKQKGPEQS